MIIISIKLHRIEEEDHMNVLAITPLQNNNTFNNQNILISKFSLEKIKSSLRI